MHAVRRIGRAAVVLIAAAQAVMVAGCCSITTIRTESLPDATVGQPYSATLEHNCSGKDHLQNTEDWRTSGTTPPGIGLSREGRFSGTPTTAGTFSFDVQLGVSDISSFSIQDTRRMTLTVRP
jgi:hypothetical protein